MVYQGRGKERWAKPVGVMFAMLGLIREPFR